MSSHWFQETEDERQARYAREADEMKLKWDARCRAHQGSVGATTGATGATGSLSVLHLLEVIIHLKSDKSVILLLKHLTRNHIIHAELYTLDICVVFVS